MGQFNEDSFQNLLIYNNIYYNLLKNKLHENEILLFIEDVVADGDVIKNIVIDNNIANNEVDMDIDNLIIDITNNSLEDAEMFKKLASIFVSHGYSYSIEYDIFNKRNLVVEF